MSDMEQKKVKIGVSACLLGEKVRYNGGHKLNNFLVKVLGPNVEYVPVCPEVEIGLSIPREPMRLVKHTKDKASRLVTQQTKIDYTAQMLEWAETILDRLEEQQLRGYVFKSKSPSCGIGQVNVYDETGGILKNGIGIFARAFKSRFSSIPVVDEERLQNMEIRRDFIARINGQRRRNERKNEYRTSKNS
jgi:uncharacterized protein YbbK (DUF523 family)